MREVQKTCSRCGISKDLNQYNSRGGGKPQPHCRECDHERVAELRSRGYCGGPNTRPRDELSEERTFAQMVPESIFYDEEEKREVPEQPMRKEIPESQTYVITYAQNATYAHEGFLSSLESYCRANEAELAVIPGLYKNPTSRMSKDYEHDRIWDDRLHPYLFNGRGSLGDNITAYGDISIQPTANRPLTGFEVFVGENSGVFGHPKLQFKTVPTAQRKYPRILTTTGAVTQRDYTESKAGKKGEAHHKMGACIVERSGKLFHMRQIMAMDDGSFIDLDREYLPSGNIRRAPAALGLVCGDIHVERSDDAVIRATFTDRDSIVRTLTPQKIVYHDVLDFERRNHHTIHDFQYRYARITGSKLKDRVDEEVLNAVRFLDDKTPPGTEYYVVQSNHDEAFDRWLAEADPKLDPLNARFFHESWVLKLAEFDRSKTWKTAFELWYHKSSSRGEAEFLTREESLKIADIYCNFHGDKGINGARGSTQSYSHLGVKTIIGHHHAPAILDECFQVGVTGALDQDYNYLPSSWLQTHCVIYANGARSLLSVIDGSWRRGR